MQDLEDRLKGLGDRVARNAPSELRPTERALRRIRVGRAVRSGAVLATVAAVMIGGFAGARALSSDEALPPAEEDSNVSAFVDTWVGTDIDGSTQTMVVRASGEGAFNIVVRDDSAGVCSGTPSTMTGTGRLNGAGELVIPSAVLTCNDGSEPKAEDGLSVEGLLRNLTFVHHVDAGVIQDSFGVVWHRGDTIQSSGGMWPQSSIEEIREAQRLADEGDPRYTWQVDPKLAAQKDPYGAEIFARFFQEELGWQEFRGMSFMRYEGAYDSGVFVRCASGRTNPLYPNDPQGRGCAPTIDELHYETVQVNVAQVELRGPSGLWVVMGWRTLPPSGAPITGTFADFEERQVEQVVPPSDVDVTGLLDGFLQARIDGEGAEEYLHPLEYPGRAVPLLYTTSSGAPYARFEIVRRNGPVWPTGHLEFRVRLLAEGENTVVEQAFYVYRDEDGRLGLEYFGEGTTENGKVVPNASSILDGQVTYSTPSDWREISGVPERGFLEWRRNGGAAGMEIRVPDALPTDCDASGDAPPSAEELVRAIRSDPDLEATAPVPARVGGIDALRLDVAAAPGAETCPTGRPVVSDELGRLYVVDLPEPLRAPSGSGPGDPARTLTILITVRGSQADFERAVADAAPILDSFEFHAP